MGRKTMRENLLIKPIDLICQNTTFIQRLSNIFRSAPAIIKLEKNAKRKATAIAKKMSFALSDCLAQNSIKPFKHFIEHLFTQLSKKKRREVLQECYRHLNSSEIVFSGKYQWLGNRFFTKLGGIPGKLLGQINELIENEIKKNDQADTAQNARNSSSNMWTKQLLVWGYYHGEEIEAVEQHPNAKTVDWIIGSIRSPKRREYALFEGLDTNEQFPCAGENLICRGWEFMSAFNESISHAKNVASFMSQVYEFRTLKEHWLKQPSSSKRSEMLVKIDSSMALAEHHLYKSDNKLVASIKPRNKGIIHTVKSIFKEDPDTRIYVKGGAMHFFTKNSMVSYNSSNSNAELRDYLGNLDAMGKPVALLYLRDDQHLAESYANSGYR